jgi:molybdopterin molybdotransferase
MCLRQKGQSARIAKRKGHSMKYDYEQAMSCEDAIAQLRAHWSPSRDIELTTLPQALGRVLASDVASSVTLPVVRSSMRDGVAVKSSAWAQGEPDTSGWVRGREWERADTGDDFSDDYDAVIAIEQVTIDECNRLTIQPGITAKAGDLVRQAGSIVRKGDLIARAGTRLSPEILCALSTAGAYQIEVVRKPRVGFVPTGSELVACGSVPMRGENIESNSLMVDSFLKEWGADATIYPIVRDDQAALERTFDEALAACDIVLINGGSSRGDEDFNSEMIKERAEWFRHGIRAVPGRPVGIAVVNGKAVINVPGPSPAAWLAMDWLVRDMICYALGTVTTNRPHVMARLGFEAQPLAKFDRFMRLLLARDSDGCLVCSKIPDDWGTPMVLAHTDAMWRMPAGQNPIAAGTMIDVELLRPIECIVSE